MDSRVDEVTTMIADSDADIDDAHAYSAGLFVWFNALARHRKRTCSVDSKYTGQQYLRRGLSNMSSCGDYPGSHVRQKFTM